MNELQQIMDACKCGVYLKVNIHRDVYETTADTIAEIRQRGDEISVEQEQEMIESDTIIDLQFYPDTPIGSYSVYGHNLESVIIQAKECLDI